MAVGYQTHFELNLEELYLVEKALRNQVKALYETQSQQKPGAGSCNDIVFQTRMADIQSLLGKLHNQKKWFAPKEIVALA